MINLIAGAALLALFVYGLKLWTNADPKVLLAILKRAGAVVALAGAVFALVTGRFALALPLGIAGFALLGKVDPQRVGAFGPFGALLAGVFGAFGGNARPKISRVRGAVVEMELDHTTGQLRGQILAGPHAGESLDALDVPSIIGLRAICDPQSLALLEAYLDRRVPAWRENVQDDPGRRDMGGAAAGAMTKDEAYQILGLEPGAEDAAVRSAHRTLMKKFHPDHGGTSYLAARINQAKDTILGKHG